MLQVYGFGFNGYGQIKTKRQDVIYEPTMCCIQHKDIKESDTQITHLSSAWESVLYLQDGHITLRGFCHNQSHSTCFLNLKDLNITSAVDVAMLAHREDLIGVLLHSKKFYLYQIIHQDQAKECPNANNLAEHSHNISLLFACEDELIKTAACGFNKSKWTIVTENSQVKTIKASGEFGKYNLLPEITINISITEISCGYDHCLALTSSGRVYSWGIGSRGQLGHGNLASFDQPRLVEALDGVKMRQVCCGGWHSAALAETNDLYTWGWNESGQTGFPAPKNIFSTSTKIESKTKQTTVSETDSNGDSTSPLSATESAAAPSTDLSFLEKSVAFGVKEQGSDIVEESCHISDDPPQYEPVGMITTPMLLELEGYLDTKDHSFVSVLQVACGSRHTAAILLSGQLVTWGWAKYGQLSHNCCLKNSNAGIDANASRLCSNTPHHPALVSWFEKKALTCCRLWCGLWNTFVEVSSI